MIELDRLREVSVFRDLTDDRLQWLRANIVEFCVNAGDVLLRQGELSTGLLILLDGELATTRREDGQDYVERFHAPDVFGTPCMVASIPFPATLTAIADSRLARLPEVAFRELFVTCSPFGRMAARVMTDWLTALETAGLNRAKLAALGKLAAGLAHELNNPAAALTRALDHMRGELAVLEESALALGGNAVPREAVTQLGALVSRHGPQAFMGAAGSLERSDAESRLGDWLAARRVAKPWLSAPVLVAHGIASDDLDQLANDLEAAQFDAAVNWVARVLDLRAMVDEAMQGALRISDIVAAMKSYSFMDQGPQQEIDIHDGIDDTLTVMTHEMKRGIHVTRDYDRSLPRLQVYGSELNQVWTRLIENAVEAMDGHGSITIRTRRDGHCAVVEFIDDGPGIPPGVVTHLFEPFFTSGHPPNVPKEGLGLGLHIAYRIVVNRHGGTIQAQSGTRGTTFRVSLPLLRDVAPPNDVSTH
ncbi:ATP-binding protein [Paraburkholderia phymatum]|uniref:histidine kinase n=1 Tax=Paraburkholderia phymatum (strain DSM 17167 / CIP 108236 / LMG 21445 / STM815) TaxID=391038 RepID=B2JQZ5_PARP8|nr:ATP-binding protein [Paraburkholderia phymatum]ACC73686.1 cyclic nucleotide-binding protein [Paraburkholderia phymatum STM815]